MTRELRMLVVEDEFLAQQLLKSLLADYGTIEVVADGNQAVRAVRQAYETGHSHDLIFMDIRLVGLDGLSALGQIRDYETKHGVPDRDACRILMTTGMSDPHFVLEAFKQRCDGFLAKPISREKLMEAIAKLDLEGRGCPPPGMRLNGLSLAGNEVDGASGSR